ncbi:MULTISPECIES: glycosyltransferase family 4 protein [unclassified Streptomyces]|uniref:glycosyltransferase family 4 protein n=1 Tax=unclassified Streptomyces TaxID=2593676 RepID=UPI0008848453|nr:MULTISPECIES: glycosyltransferase family 4 protein [unclassified Streptomyces]PBC85171.1 glycosyltransferase involved in cell wall bisynthesis [Streptomyces sp. 2321.6]SDR20813.1 Glycosyltransferase involved in cell wall bisynthesis [Streptomyces sp. KS_16]SED58375.1 Glycosyltransferase involved in cell wall bisynthesis [Streptomyces sp. 2133.1]SEE25878.1 Glycosyltransferase involved in cell wall bisynthesis [Streptomyces sp. 2112.3]SNC71193.1 Glycosyltransferase involved in cell wall bisyn
MKITLLLHNAYAIGGTIRTTFNLAAALADRHDVEIVSMLRHREVPRFTVDPRVRLVPLVDTRVGSEDMADPLFGEPARDFPLAEKRHHQYSRLTDVRAAEFLRTTEADVLIGTRPGINVYLARFGPRRALRIAQEHLRHDAHSKRLRAELARHYRTLDALVTTTEADAAVYRSRMPLPGVRVLAVPNIVPAPDGPPSEGTSKVIAAAGRLVRGKRFDLLIEAFSAVAAKHPDWRLRIHGGGAERAQLQGLIDGLGLNGQAELTGPRSPIEAEFAKASIVASASDAESFGMTLVEAMRCGVPVVSTDCPLGPAEIIHDGTDGLLVPRGDGRAMAGALLRLIEDPQRRRDMAGAALESSHRYDPEPIAERYELLFQELRSTRAARAWRRTLARARAVARRVVRRALRR